MTTQTEADRLADGLERDRWIAHGPQWCYDAAAELRRLVSFNQQLMDEVARLNKAVADEREACAKVCETHAPTTTPAYVSYAATIRARGNT